MRRQNFRIAVIPNKAISTLAITVKRLLNVKQWICWRCHLRFSKHKPVSNHSAHVAPSLLHVGLLPKLGRNCAFSFGLIIH